MRNAIAAGGALLCVLILLAVAAGCTAPAAKPSYTVSSDGVLAVTCGPVTTTEQVLFTNETYTKTKIVLHTFDGDVVTYLAAPQHPKAVLVYAPGAGEKLSGHEDRMVRLSAAGFAFLFVDTRGNGGETPGYPFNPQLDFSAFENGAWPEYYLTVCDLSSARQLLADRFGVPVYAIGSSNGGRYAAVAAGTDKKFAGYIGVSTSDWGVLSSAVQQGYTGDPIRFATSIEPGTYLSRLSPRPVWMFHSRTDPIIPFAQGQALFAEASEPKTFTEFPGGHGIDASVDNLIIGQWAQIYGSGG
ncbi:MAG TPA: alpha/beta hydrolase [Methanoregula sp.]|nr:alpha/beta hydrolase [Methanoregula sp.]